MYTDVKDCLAIQFKEIVYIRGHRELQTDHGSQHLAESGKNDLPNIISKRSPKI